MNLLDLMIKVGVDDQATPALGEIGGRARGALATAAKAAVGAAAAAAAGVGVLTKASLDGYAAYEQNVGGVQKLFGNMGQSLEEYAAMTGQTCDEAAAKWQELESAQTTMLDQARGAYKTCGMSANRYMEQATSFSAALINSLGGDTVKAAAQAQKAMVAMSDNVNTFGTDMTDVQNAFQGFAKQNYTMLDNLKLGYGGTKEEMQRLISDANEYAKSIGLAGDLSIDSFSDIVDAIDLVQQKQNIAGTTAREAATTIEGSINMTRAAWENWVTGLADDSADIDALTGELVDSAITAASNIVPRLGEIVVTAITRLPSVIQGLAPVVADSMRSMFESTVEGLRGALPSSFSTLFDGLADLDGAIASSGLGETVANVFQGIGPAANAAMESIGRLASKLSGPVSAAASVLAPVIQAVADVISWLVSNLDGIVPVLATVAAGFGAFQAITSVVGMVTNLVAALGPVADVVGMVVGAIAAGEPVMATLGAALGLIASPATLVVAGISAVVAVIVALATNAGGCRDMVTGAFLAIVDIVMQVGQAIGAFIIGVIAAVGTFGASLVQGAISIGSGFLGGIVGFFSQLPGSIGGWLSGAISTVAGWVGQFAANAQSAASTFGARLRDGLAAIPGTLGSIGSNIIGGIVNGITGAAGRVRDAIGNAIGNAIDFAKHILGIASPSKLFKKFGYFTMEGMRIGIDQNAGLPLGATERAMAAVAEAGSVQMDAPDVRSAAATASVVEWLERNLGDIIASCTPVMGESEFGRKARKAVAYA